MTFFNNLRIGTKLLGSFALVAVVAALIGWSGYSGVLKLEEGGAALYRDNLLPMRDLGYANVAFLLARNSMWEAVATKDRASRVTLAAAVEDQSRKMEAYIESYSRTQMTRDESLALAKFRQDYERYQKFREDILAALLRSDERAAWVLLTGDARMFQQEVRVQLRGLIDLQAKLAEEGRKADVSAAEQARNRIVFFLCAGVLASLGLGVLISRLIGKPVNQLARAADRLASGATTVDLPSETGDEIGKLAASFRIMAATVAERAQPSALPPAISR